mmetsp:Transcript_4203/g.6139  ORF Transcript_4203/g.6139 Transcript_4203/m.6139 type:complete len:92 (-) Transcript_4203:138-413(-)
MLMILLSPAPFLGSPCSSTLLESLPCLAACSPWVFLDGGGFGDLREPGELATPEVARAPEVRGLAEGFREGGGVGLMGRGRATTMAVMSSR